MRISSIRIEKCSAVVVVVLLGVGSSAFGQRIGLVAAYGFDEGTGPVVGDVSAHGNSGVLSGATWTAGGRFSKALFFDGSDAFVTVNDSASLDLTNGMTLEAWVHPTAASGTWSTILIKEASGGLDYILGTDPANRPTCSLTIGNIGMQAVTGTEALALNVWTHLAATYDGTTLRLYANGVEIAGRPVSGDIAISDSALRIGGNSVWGEYFTGMIDEVQVYNRALTLAEIQNDMIAPAGDGLPPDTQPPTGPEDLLANSISSSQILLSWKPATDDVGVSEYLVERRDPGSASFVEIGTTTATSFYSTALVAGTIYGYRVRAADAAGNLSIYSSVASATTSIFSQSGGASSPDFSAEVHEAIEGPGSREFNGMNLPLTVNGANTLLIAAWHSEYDRDAPESWRVEWDGVPGTLITDTNGYTGDDGNRRFRTYYWVNPTPGAKLLVVTNDVADSDNELAVSAVLLTNVAQANPIRAVALDVSTGDRTSESETVATTTNDLVVHIIADALVTRGTLGSGETSRSVANDGKHAVDGDASLWISTKRGSLRISATSRGRARSIANSAIGRVAGPADSTITRSDIAIASSRSCVMNSTALRFDCQMSRTSFSIN